MIRLRRIFISKWKVKAQVVRSVVDDSYSHFLYTGSLFEQNIDTLWLISLEQVHTYFAQKRRKTGLLIRLMSASLLHRRITYCFLLLLLPTYSQLMKSNHQFKLLKVWTDEATGAPWDCFECTKWHIFRDAATQDHDISKCLYYVLITKAGRSFPNQMALFWAKAAFWSGDKEAHETAREDWELPSRRKRWDMRHWRETATPTAVKICGRRFKMSQVTKAGASVRSRCQRSWAHLMLALISTKAQLLSSH